MASKPTLLVRLRDAALGLMTPNPERSSTQRRTVAVFFSLFVSFVLWFTFSMRETYAVLVEMPVEVRGVPRNQALVGLPDRDTRVTVQGEGWDLLKLLRNPPSLPVSAEDETVDLEQAANEMTKLPPSVSIQSVVPAQIEIELEPRLVRKVPIQLKGQVETGEAFGIIGQPSLFPDSVRIGGARSIVRTIEAWPTEPLDRADVQKGFLAEVALSDTLSGLVQKDEQLTRVTVSVGRFTETERSVPVRVDGAPRGMSVRTIPNRITVRYVIPTSQFDQAEQSEDFYAFVPYADILRDTVGTVQAYLNIPDDLSVRQPRMSTDRLEYFVRTEG